MFGGQSRQGCLVYTHANGADIAEALDSVQKHIAEGYLAVRAQAGVPGIASSYGVPKAGKPYEPAERDTVGGLPSESLWSTERYLNFAPQLFEKQSPCQTVAPAESGLTTVPTTPQQNSGGRSSVTRQATTLFTSSAPL